MTQAPSLPFTCRKAPASGSGGVVVTNHPLGSAAGHEMLAAGGNAVDAAVAALLALTVVEPMMVGIAGGGVAHLRTPDGRHVVYDCLSHAGAAATPGMFRPVSDRLPDYMETEGRRNLVGPAAVAVPGNLRGWCAMQAAQGALPFADVIAPAIRLAAGGFRVTAYLNGTIQRHAADLARDPVIAALFLPGGAPATPGHRLVQGDYAESLRQIAREGDTALHGGSLGAALVERLGAEGSVSLDDLRDYRARERDAIFADYRGHQIAGPPPPASSGVHVAQMLNILEGYDLAAMGFDSAARLHLLAEVIRVGFEDRRAASGDPDFVDIPVERLISKDYARDCRARLRDAGGAGPVPPGHESRNTTHVTVADRDGFVVSATHTINGLFGARVHVDGGVILNDHLASFAHPRDWRRFGGNHRANAPRGGARPVTSMSPTLVLKGNQPVLAVGAAGGPTIITQTLLAMVHTLDYGLSLKEALAQPRFHHQWKPDTLRIELRAGQSVLNQLRQRGHQLKLYNSMGATQAVGWFEGKFKAVHDPRSNGKSVVLAPSD